jgi:Holliday junction resolvasome RuvABC endonuclease subunit
MTILIGIDPGFRNIGVAFYHQELKEIISWNHIEPKGYYETEVLIDAVQKVREYIARVQKELLSERIDAVIIEQPYFNSSVKWSNQIVETVGALKYYVANELRTSIYTLSATEVKKAYLGPGKHTKAQIKKIVGADFKIKFKANEDHAADAIMIAVVGGERLETCLDLAVNRSEAHWINSKTQTLQLGHCLI